MLIATEGRRRTRSSATFQSLIGINVNSYRPGLKGLLYLVFKVLLRQPDIKVAFQTLSCQEWLQEKRLKSSYSKGFGVCANLNSVLNGSKAEAVRV